MRTYTPTGIDELRDLLSLQVAFELEMIAVRTARSIATHYLLPVIQDRLTEVWAAQIIFPESGTDLLVRFNERVEGKIQFRYDGETIEGRASDSSDVKVTDIQKITLPSSEAGFYHVTLFIDHGKGKSSVKILHGDTSSIMPALMQPPIPGREEIAPSGDLVFSECQACERYFIPEPSHPHQQYCSTKCRERLKKQRHRERRKQQGTCPPLPKTGLDPQSNV